jgi:hypothetical protein
MRRFLSGPRLALVTVGELVRGLWRGPRWWLVPVLLILLPIAALLVFLQAVPLVAPFVYAVF